MDFPYRQHFVAHYQKLLFDERSADPYQVASLRRKRLAQTFKTSLSISDNITTCNVYEKDLKSYSEVVDDKNNVNNYAESIQAILQFSQVECKQWKSTIDKNVSIEEFHCNSHDVDEKDIQFLVQAKDNKSYEEKGGSSIPQLFFTNFSFSNKLVPPITFKGTETQTKKEQSFSKMLVGKTMENTKSYSSLIGKTNNSFQSGSKNGTITHNSDPQNSNISWHSNTNRNSHKSIIPSPLSSGTAPRSVLQQQNYTGVHSYPVMEEKKNQYQKSYGFSTAKDELIIQNHKKWGSRNMNSSSEYIQKKSLGSTRRSVMNKFIPPIKNSSEEESGSTMGHQESYRDNSGVEDERLKNIDPKMVELIQNEIMDCGTPVHWDDIAGLQFAKTTIQEIVVWPMLRPEIFTGLRRPPKGILLFGPPGTGKTLIGKCIASQSFSTFFSISASSLTSKWIGDGEKMVRALFAVARCHQPAVIFIDEIDSLLTQRSDTEHESSRRIKTEFLVQLDGATTGEEDRILVVGATNRPQELDEAARRRLVKRLYIPLPDHEARCQIIQRLMCKERNCLTEEQIKEVGSLTEGYSGADVKNLCQEASLGPIRSIHFMDIQSISPEQVRPIAFEDFECALKRVRASVSSCDLDIYLKWDKTYGSG